MNKDFILITDFFAQDLQFPGGAECCDDVIVEEINKIGKRIFKIRSRDVTIEFLNSFVESCFIISNFVQLREESKNFIEQNCKYVIYEHDYKFLLHRNPSFYSNFNVPFDHLVNVRFYEKAVCVIVQSDYHKQIVEKCLPKCKFFKAGISLWSDEQFDHIKKNLESGKGNKISKTMILDSPIFHKNTEGAIQYCKNKYKDFVLVSGEWSSFIESMSKCAELVFLPHSPETMSRVVVEAKMLNLRVITTKNVGAFHESWFSMNGESLINYHIEKKQKLIEDVVGLFNSKQQDVGIDEIGDITVILNLYRRPHNLKMQVESIRNQSIKPKEIWLWINEHKDNKVLTNEQIREMGVDKIFRNDFNWKFYGRFCSGLLADTKYVAFFDDDTIPGTKWFENCISTMNSDFVMRGVLGSAGVVFETEKYNPHIRVGWPNPNKKVEKVDLVGHAWFMERQQLACMWREIPPTWETGEDMFLSYCVQKYSKLGTYVPPHPPGQVEMWGSIRGNELGIDNVATSNNNEKTHSQFFRERDELIEKLRGNGWRLLKDG